MPSGAVAYTSRPSTPPRCSPSSAAPPQRAQRSPRRRQLESRAWWRLRTSAPLRARRPRRCRRRSSGSGRKQRACWFERRELVALWPPSHGPVFWRPQGSRPLLRRDRSCAPHRLACAAACTRDGAVCVRLRPPLRVSADTQRARLSCYQQAGGAATRLIMSSLAGPGGLSEQEAAAVRWPHPRPRPTPACTRRARAVHRHARWSRRKPPSCARRSRTRSATGARESAPPRSGGWSSRPCGTARIEWLGNSCIELHAAALSVASPLASGRDTRRVFD